MKDFLFPCAFILLSLWGCQSRENGRTQKQLPKENTYETYPLTLEYAQNLEIHYLQGITLVKIGEPFKGSSQSLTYYFIPKDLAVPDSLLNEAIIRTPVERFACTSTTHLPALDLLGVTDRLVGFPSLKFVSSPQVRALAREGKVVDLGKDYSLNVEQVIEADPGVLMSYSLDGDYKDLGPIQKAGIDILMNADYLENDPLGRAEWIKFFGLLFHKEKEADSIFNTIASDYRQVLGQAQATGYGPTTFCGIDYKGVWYMPGGDSWMGKFLKDAQASYYWGNDTSTGSMELSFETVYDSAYEADVWINAHTFKSLEELGEADERYKRFRAFQKGAIYNSNARLTPEGGNDYYESGTVRPDIVLKDLVKIFHPDLLPNYKLYYFQKLN